MRDSRLLTELSGHIQPTIARLRAGIPVENPAVKGISGKLSFCI